MQWVKLTGEMTVEYPKQEVTCQIRSVTHPKIVLIHEIPRFDSVFVSRNKGLWWCFDICAVSFGWFCALLLVGEGIKRGGKGCFLLFVIKIP